MEVKQYGVHVEHLNTFFVQTQMSKIRKSSFLVPTPQQYVSSCLRNCGYSLDSTPYFSHWLVESVLDIMVPFVWQRRIVYDENAKTRNRAIKKIERQKKQ